MCLGVVDCVKAVLYAWKDKDYIYLVLEWAPEVGCRLQGAGSCAYVLLPV
jgi:hypothetical protein